MNYCTITDIENDFGTENVKGWLGFLIDDEYDAQALAAIASAIETASAMADGYLSKKYVTPLSATDLAAAGHLVRFPTISLAASILFTSRSITQSRIGDAKAIGERYKNAISMLEELGNMDGDMELPDSVARRTTFTYGNASTACSHRRQPFNFRRIMT